MRVLKHVICSVVALSMMLYPAQGSNAAGTAPAGRDENIQIVRGVLQEKLKHAIGGEIEETTYTIVGESEKCNVDPVLILSMIRIESNFDIEIISPMGARGLMQLMPQTFAAMSDTKRSFAPAENVRAGVKYVCHLKSTGFERTSHFLLAYNAGPWSASRIIAGKRNHSDESKKYVPAVMKKYDEYTELYRNR